MDTLPYHRRNYKLLEKRYLDLFSIVNIDDNNFNQKNYTYSDLIYGIAPLIESLAKDLHEELAEQFPTLPQFKPKEKFDYDALAFLDKALGLSQKQVKVTSDLVAISDKNRVLTPLAGAHEEEASKRPLWIKAYQSYKHNQAKMQANAKPDTHTDQNTDTQRDSSDCPTAKLYLRLSVPLFYSSLSPDLCHSMTQSGSSSSTLPLALSSLKQPTVVCSLTAL